MDMLAKREPDSGRYSWQCADLLLLYTLAKRLEQVQHYARSDRVTNIMAKVLVEALDDTQPKDEHGESW